MNTPVRRDQAYWDRLQIEADKRKPFTGELPRRSIFRFSSYRWNKTKEKKQ